jgi:hypothetical protein
VDRTSFFAKLLLAFALLTLVSGVSLAQSWQAVAQSAPLGVGSMLLLTDGRVLVHAEQANAQIWYTLTPDNTGSYVHGTWKQVGSMPAGYAPVFFGSAVLKNGNVIVEGGEYNNGASAWTTKGALFNPKTNKWVAIAPPAGWGTIGDAQGMNLPNGKYMQASCCDSPPKTAIFNPGTKTWTPVGTGKFDIYDEEGWTLLPNGKVLTVDAYVGQYSASGKQYELYNPATATWTHPGNTPVQLWDSCGGASAASYEVGPAVLRPDGTVFATGANGCGSGHTAIYNSATGTWTTGPDFVANDVADGPAALEINGKVLVMASPGTFNTVSTFYEWNGSTLTTVAGPPNAPLDSSFYGHFLELPSGQLLFTDYTTDVEVFTPSGTFNSSWRPTVVTSPATVVHATNGYKITGTQLTGLSEGAMYGDDYQSATNYPLVRIVNNSTHHVMYCRTRSFSTMGVATGSKIVSTLFDVPAATELGASTLFVVANGIPSAGTAITVN